MLFPFSLVCQVHQARCTTPRVKHSRHGHLCQVLSLHQELQTRRQRGYVVSRHLCAAPLVWFLLRTAWCWFFHQLLFFSLIGTQKKKNLDYERTVGSLCVHAEEKCLVCCSIVDQKVFGIEKCLSHFFKKKREREPVVFYLADVDPVKM